MTQEIELIENSKKIDKFNEVFNGLFTLGLLNLACYEADLYPTDLPFDASSYAFEAKMQFLENVRNDWVESKLMELIDAGDVNATIFYCANKLKGRGYQK